MEVKKKTNNFIYYHNSGLGHKILVEFLTAETHYFPSFKSFCKDLFHVYRLYLFLYLFLLLV